MEHLPPSTWFFTVSLAQPGGQLLTRHIGALREAYRRTAATRPILCEAMVVLPDRIHALWTLPDGDHAARWRLIKARFTLLIGRGEEGPVALPREAAVWQRGVQQHLVQDAAEKAALRRICLQAPVSLGLVKRVEEWPFSTLHRDLRAA